MEALTNQALSTPYIKILRELYKKFTTKITPFYRGRNEEDKESSELTFSIRYFFPTLAYAPETLTLRKQDERLMGAI
ncbi:hypothetical protein DICVIV_09585 [Dictyocaulus viviparus]|uniref:Uncharacterized protein n=1 Tax=Dictyocaulus viviparus TaxID=29172 RepID=A0A0D8XKM0_DICVI|nr:hypothetical protein DICVIV_09585 [Dictyocaulus viviparus]